MNATIKIRLFLSLLILGSLVGLAQLYAQALRAAPVIPISHCELPGKLSLAMPRKAAAKVEENLAAIPDMRSPVPVTDDKSLEHAAEADQPIQVAQNTEMPLPPVTMPQEVPPAIPPIPDPKMPEVAPVTPPATQPATQPKLPKIPMTQELPLGDVPPGPIPPLPPAANGKSEPKAVQWPDVTPPVKPKSVAKPQKTHESAPATTQPVLREEPPPPAFEPLNPSDSPVTPPVQNHLVKHHQPVGSDYSKPVAQIIKTNYSGLSIDKRGPSLAAVGELLTYEIVLRNSGSREVRGIVVNDFIPPKAELLKTVPDGKIAMNRVMWEIPILPAGAEQRFQVLLRPTEPGKLHLSSAAFVTISRKELLTKVRGRPLKISVELPDSNPMEKEIPIKVTLDNLSDHALANYLISLKIPEGLSHPAGNQIEGDVPTIGPYQNKTIDFGLTPTKEGIFTVELALTSPAKETMVRRIPIKVERAAGLVLKKIGLPVLEQNKETEYRIELVNQSNNDAINVILTEQLPEGIEFVGSSDKGVYNPKTREVQWIFGKIAAGQVRAVGLKITGKKAGISRNIVNAEAQGGIRVELTANLIVQQSQTPKTQSGPLGFFKRIGIGQ